MKVSLIDRRKTKYFSALSNDFLYDTKKIDNFIERPFTIENIISQARIKASHFTNHSREILVDTIQEQYKGLNIHDATKSNIKALRNEHTFTVTTGHQLNLFGGPLYVTYKIIQAIKIAEQASKHSTEFKFVPIFWMATEDHDFLEINHLNIFGQKIEWQTKQNGAVGRFTFEDFEALRDLLSSYFENSSEIKNIISKFYSNSDINLSVATRRFINELFGKYGLVILDGDSAVLKKSFTEIAQKELLENFTYSTIQSKSKQIAELGYKLQVNPREVNLFLLEKNKRQRIIKKDNYFVIGEKKYSLNEILNLVKKDPSTISPNVLLRPVYQEIILPNVAYIGGGAEISYWLQLKDIFNSLNLDFPILNIRNSFQIFPSEILKRIQNLKMSISDFFDDKEKIIKEFIFTQSKSELDFSSIENCLTQLNEEILEKIIGLDPNLAQYAQSEIIKQKKLVDSIKQKLLKHQKNKFDTSILQIERLFNKIFPNNGLQERHENLLSMGSIYGIEGFIGMIYESCNIEFCDLILLHDE